MNTFIYLREKMLGSECVLLDEYKNFNNHTFLKVETLLINNLMYILNTV